MDSESQAIMTFREAGARGGGGGTPGDADQAGASSRKAGLFTAFAATAVQK